MDWASLKATVAISATLAPDHKIREALTPPLKYPNGFLFTISEKRLKSKDAKKKLMLYKKECYRILFEYFNQGFALNVKKLEDFSVQKTLISEVKKAVSPLPFKSQELQHFFLAEENVQYSKTVLKHPLNSYFKMLSLVNSSIQFKDLKKAV